MIAFVHIWTAVPIVGALVAVAWVVDGVVEGHVVMESNWRTVAARVESVLAAPDVHVIARSPSDVAMHMNALLSRAGCAGGVRVSACLSEREWRNGLAACSEWLASLAR